jgi:hypothetical protein
VSRKCPVEMCQSACHVEITAIRQSIGCGRHRHERPTGQHASKRKTVRKGLLTGWSLVRIRPGEPAPKNRVDLSLVFLFFG